MSAAEADTHIAAPIERVWRAWADPTELARWYPDRATGALDIGQRLHWIWDCYGMELELEVVAAEPPHRFVLAADPSGRRVQTQEVTLSSTSTGTRIHLRHGPFPDTESGADERAGSAAGWTTALATLAHYLTHYPGRDRTTAALLTDVTASPEQTYQRLASYPRPADATLLVETPPYELAYALPALDTLVTLRSFTLGGHPTARLAGAHLSTWGPHLDRGRSQLFNLLDHLTG